MTKGASRAYIKRAVPDSGVDQSSRGPLRQPAVRTCGDEVALNNMTDAYLRLDARLRIKRANHAAECILGRTRARLAGRRLSEVLRFSGGAGLVPLCRRALRSGAGGSYEGYSAADALWLEFRVYPCLDGLILLFRDSSHLKRASEFLRDCEARARLLFHSSSDSIWIYDRCNWRVLAVNDAATIRYGYSSDEFLQMALADLIVVEHAVLARALAAPVLFNQPRRFRCQHRLREGGVTAVELFAYETTYDGRPAAMILARDVWQSWIPRPEPQSSGARPVTPDAACEACIKP